MPVTPTTSADNAGVEDTAAIDRLVGEGTKEGNYLDAIFHIKYAHNPDKLAGWLTAYHLERAPKHAKKEDKAKPTQ